MKSKSRAASLAQCKRALAGLPYMDELSADDIQSLLPLARVHDYCAGSTLFYEDDEPDAVFFIERGAIEVFKSDGAGKKLPLAVMRESGVVGEMGLLSKEPRSATVRTLGPVRAVVLQSQAVDAALASGSIAAFRLVLGLARVLSVRLAHMDQKMFEMCLEESNGASLTKYAEANQDLKTW